MRSQQRRTSKFLSFVLRHDPQSIGIELDEAGWTDVEQLLDALRRHGRPLDRRQLEAVVRFNDKQRFSFSEDGRRIRANQGHSVPVQLQHPQVEPPQLLYHGTTSRFLAGIRCGGLQKASRHHVHLSPSQATASSVGSRRGKPLILTIRAGAMHEAGHVFYLTPNGVWLTEQVPPQFIDFPPQG